MTERVTRVHQRRPEDAPRRFRTGLGLSSIDRPDLRAACLFSDEKTRLLRQGAFDLAREEQAAGLLKSCQDLAAHSYEASVLRPATAASNLAKQHAAYLVQLPRKIEATTKGLSEFRLQRQRTCD